MPNTEYEHAGNSDQIRQMQFDLAPRCQLCHYTQGYQLVNSDTVIALQIVTVPVYGDCLLCQLCVALCRAAGDVDHKNASTIMRQLPPKTVDANRALLAELQGK